MTFPGLNGVADHFKAIASGLHPEAQFLGLHGFERGGVGILDPMDIFGLGPAQGRIPGHGIEREAEPLLGGWVGPHGVVGDETDEPEVWKVSEHTLPLSETALAAFFAFVQQIHSTTQTPDNEMARTRRPPSRGTAKPLSKWHTEPRRSGADPGAPAWTKIRGFRDGRRTIRKVGSSVCINLPREKAKGMRKFLVNKEFRAVTSNHVWENS